MDSGSRQPYLPEGDEKKLAYAISPVPGESAEAVNHVRDFHDFIFRIAVRKDPDEHNSP